MILIYQRDDFKYAYMRQQIFFLLFLCCLVAMYHTAGTYLAVTLVFALTRTVAILLGNAFARIENDAVIAAAKPTASIALTKKHKLMNIGPLGTLSSILKKKPQQNSKWRSLRMQHLLSHLLKALQHRFLFVKGQLQDTQCFLLPHLF